MNRIKSPFIVPDYSDDDIFVPDYPEMQKRVYFRAAKQARRQTLGEHLINCGLWSLGISLAYWMWVLFR